MSDEKCRNCEQPACDGCQLCCCAHPGHTLRWEPWGCPDCNARIAALMEQGWKLASERDDLIAQGVNPTELLIPLAPDQEATP